MLTSLDPRVTRLGLPDDPTTEPPKPALDQLETFEVFHQRKEGQAYVYVGPVHAASADVAFLFGKEQYSRRMACSGMWVVATRQVLVTRYTDEAESVYTALAADLSVPTNAGEAYEIFQLKKRGKAHQHVGTVIASSPTDALAAASHQFGALPGACVNVWVVRAADLLRSADEDRDLWATVTDKKYRDAIAWKVQERIERFKQEREASLSS